MDLQQRITRRLRADYDATRVNATVTIDAAAKLAALEAEDSTTDGQSQLYNEIAARTDGYFAPLVLAEPDLQALTAAGLNLPAETDVQRPVTPAGEPAAAPAVDDELLRAVGKQVRHSVYLGISDIGIARLLKVSDAGHRLRAAWTAEAEAENVQQAFELVKLRAENASLREQVDGRLRDNDVAAQALQNAWRERDEARATKDLHKERQQELEAALNTAERERDEARADQATAEASLHSTLERAEAAEQRVRELSTWELQDLRAELERLRAAQRQEEAAHDVTIDQRDRAQEMADKLAAALAGDRWIGEHSSMNDPRQNALDLPDRAAQQPLSDVGPVTRDGDKLWVNGCVYWDRFTAETWRKDGAERLALAAFLDAEADNTSSDDEVDPLDKPVRHYLDILTSGTSVEFGGSRPWKLRNMDGLDAEERQVMPDAMTVTFDDAHRARGGQEAGQ